MVRPISLSEARKSLGRLAKQVYLHPEEVYVLTVNATPIAELRGFSAEKRDLGSALREVLRQLDSEPPGRARRRVSENKYASLGRARRPAP
jgi:hypothetical protein